MMNYPSQSLSRSSDFVGSTWLNGSCLLLSSHSCEMGGLRIFIVADPVSPYCADSSSTENTCLPMDARSTYACLGCCLTRGSVAVLLFSRHLGMFRKRPGYQEERATRAMQIREFSVIACLGPVTCAHIPT